LPGASLLPQNAENTLFDRALLPCSHLAEFAREEQKGIRKVEERMENETGMEEGTDERGGGMESEETLRLR